MVDAMGGVSSEDYEQFKVRDDTCLPLLVAMKPHLLLPLQSYCSSCFIELRKNANLILNLFSLVRTR